MKPKIVIYLATQRIHGVWDGVQLDETVKIEPPEVRKAFKCACRFQVRDNISITIQNWWLMPETTKE
jgi:hypothetical protein